MPEPVVICWSGGKDSAMTLHRMKRSADYEVVALLTTVTGTYDRISMHGVRTSLLHKQRDALQLELTEVTISPEASNEHYEEKMSEALEGFLEQGIRTVVFGDIFLEDVKQYRENHLARLNMTPLFPLWGESSTKLIEEFFRFNFRAVVSCVDTDQIGEEFAGKTIDREFIDSLPAEADPCGENGEFHSFVFDGPIFRHEIPVTTGEFYRKDRFVYCDLI